MNKKPVSKEEALSAFMQHLEVCLEMGVGVGGFPRGAEGRKQRFEGIDSAYRYYKAQLRVLEGLTMYEEGQYVYIPVSTGKVETQDRFGWIHSVVLGVGGWCRGTGKAIPANEPVYYVGYKPKWKDSVNIYTFSEEIIFPSSPKEGRITMTAC